MKLELNSQSTIEYKVEEKDLAKNLQISKDDNFPAVFATARLTALMECTAAKVMIPIINDDDLSVGVEVNIKHTAPTLVGDTVKATATFIGMEGKLYKFQVEAFDSAGKVGECNHTRAIVNEERLMAGANKRVG